MGTLSPNARFVAGSTFGMISKNTLRYSMVEREPSPEVWGALNELVAAGIVVREEEDSGAITFSSAPDFDFTELREEAAKLAFSGNAPSISVWTSRDPSKAQGGPK